MDRSGVLYALVFYNKVNSQTPTPNVDFRERFPFKRRSFPILTKKRHIILPQFNQVVKLKEIIHKMGYKKSRLTMFEVAKNRKVGFHCQKCDFDGETVMSLTQHEVNHKAHNQFCQHCPYSTNRISALRTHLKLVHKEVLPLVKRKKTEYSCTQCGESFETTQERARHIYRDHKEYVQCEICKRDVIKNRLNQHLTGFHKQKKQKRRINANSAFVII